MTMLEETELGLEDIDVKHLATYLAIILARGEQEGRGITNHLPRRTVELEGRQRGTPTLAYLDSDWYYSTTKGEGKTKKKKWNWEEWQEPSTATRKTMLALFLREQVKVIITNHLYTMEGKIYHQTK